MMSFHIYRPIKFNHLLPQRQEAWVMLAGACLAIGAVLHHIVLIYVLPWGTAQQYAFGQTQWVFFVGLAGLLAFTLRQPPASHGVRQAATVLLLAQLLTIVVIVLEVQGPDRVAVVGVLNMLLFAAIHVCSVFALAPLVPWRTLPRAQTLRLGAETSLLIAFAHLLLQVVLPLTSAHWTWTPLIVASQLRLATSAGLCFWYASAYRRFGTAGRQCVVLGALGCMWMVCNDAALLWAVVEVAAGASGRWIRATTVLWMLQQLCWVLAVYWAARTPIVWQGQLHKLRKRTKLGMRFTPTQQGLMLIALVIWGSSISPSFWTTLWLGAALISREALIAHERERAHKQTLAYAAQSEELAAVHTRTDIARKLHDGVCRALNTASMQLAVCEQVLAQDPQQAAHELRMAQHHIADGQAEARQTIYALRADPQLNQPLHELLQTPINDLRATSVDVALTVLGTPRMLGSHRHWALMRVVQEGLTNIRRHAQATQVLITVDYREDSTVHISIRDNGIGANTDIGLGLLGMRERVEALDGNIDFCTARGQGFSIIMEVPG